ncbi:hypothetical protein [Sphingomonas sp. 66-10]|uniref:hypothetical protein n=1 Tax=Sphingomonas sp. 66-10 TaxID=1895848 RepID=UPI00257A1BF1|nr:hypothetical protein [Sphingomonas sp. 66-10]
MAIAIAHEIPAVVPSRADIAIVAPAILPARAIVVRRAALPPAGLTRLALTVPTTGLPGLSRLTPTVPTARLPRLTLTVPTARLPGLSRLALAIPATRLPGLPRLALAIPTARLPGLPRLALAIPATRLPGLPRLALAIPATRLPLAVPTTGLGLIAARLPLRALRLIPALLGLSLRLRLRAGRLLLRSCLARRTAIAAIATLPALLCRRGERQQRGCCGQRGQYLLRHSRTLHRRRTSRPR